MQQPLMMVSVKCEYALRALLDLALEGNGNRPVRIADIAQRQRIPQKFLELILAELKRYGYVESKRGAEGGYMLARPAELINVGQVVRSVEGARSGSGADNSDSPLAAMWQRVDNNVAAVIDRTTFAELAREYQETQSRYVPNWEI